jgi:hypothetical protein
MGINITPPPTGTEPPHLEILPLLRLGLLHNIMLHPPLPRLARIMLSLILGLLALVARQPRDRTAHRPRDPIRRARRIVADLPPSLLLLALEVLLAARLLEILPPPVSVPALQNGNGTGKRTSLPITPPTVSLAAPTVWFHEPAARSGSSRATPAAVAVAPGSLTVACDALYSACALSCLAWPWAWSPVVPRSEPTAFWTAPVAEST